MDSARRSVASFGTFADRPMASAEIAERKLVALAQAAKMLRG